MEAGDDLWLLKPMFLSGEAETPTAHYWAGVCDRVGWYCGESALNEGKVYDEYDQEVSDWPEAFPDDSEYNAFMKRSHHQYDLMNYFDYAQLLHALVLHCREINAFAAELRVRRTLRYDDVRQLMFERELVPRSLLLRPMAGTGPLLSLEEATMLNPETNLVYGELDDYGFGDRRAVYRI